MMLADTIEAAVRSMPDPTPQAIERFIERLVRGKLEDGQLSNSPMTLQDIDGVCEAFAKVLNGVFHERIEYPATPVPKRDPFFINEQEREAKEKAEAGERPAEDENTPAEQPKETPPAAEKPAYEEPEAEKVNVDFSEEVPALAERTEDHDPAVGD